MSKELVCLLEEEIEETADYNPVVTVSRKNLKALIADHKALLKKVESERR